MLLIHGTFSNAGSAYHDLASSSFFKDVAPLYGDRIFAFDHFSLSRTPEENVRMLLEALPEQTFNFDVITHSRGGLVLRNLVERAKTFGPLAKRFKLGRAVLVASPNEGTPLATPRRWEDTVGWVANLLEMIPVDNPLTTAAEFVANGIVWIARHASGDIPGLHSMDGDGDLITDLQQPPGPPAEAYSALVSNYHPSPAELMRMVDAGFDQFFGSANDLVVPSEGGWRIDRAGSSFIPGARIGCFGPGGNLPGGTVTHVGFFSQPTAVKFLVTALTGDAQQLNEIDPAKSLPDRRLVRAGGAGVSAPATPSFGGRTPAARRARLGGGARAAGAGSDESADGAPLSLSVMNGDLTFERLPLLIGHYQSTKLTGAEKVMNRTVGGAMEQALRLGNYPTDPGTHEIFVNQYVVRGQPWLTPRPQAVIVVGLGEEGSLRGSQLTASVSQAVIAWARHVAEAAGPAAVERREPVAIELATTLMASGGSGITPGQAAQLIAQGVYEANARLRANRPSKDSVWPLVTHLRLVELYLDRASEAWRELSMHTEATPGRYTLAREIARGTGPLPRSLEAGYRGADYDFISAVSRPTAHGEVEIAYTLDTKRARAEIQSVTPQGRLVRDLVATASNDQNDDPQIGNTLFKLLVPVELESFLTGSTDMQIQLDTATAGIPWELLDDGDQRRKDEDPWAIRTQLLRKLQLESGDFRAQVKDAGADAHALVIGEPQCPDDYGRLLGARAEALGVFESLSAATALGANVIKLISDDESTAGADARTIANTLFERDWRVVHIAGHGALPETDGSIGGVVLSNGTFLGPAEIKAMRVVPELVFINCCHLGASSSASVLSKTVYDRTQFAASVARELIKIGVRCVIAAGWAVDDAAAKGFAQRFYEQLLAGERFIDAVGEARRAAYKFEGNTWAAYQCYGDPDWRLRRSTAPASTPPPNNEFDGIASVTMLKLALETLVVQRTYQGYEAKYQLTRVRGLEKRWREAGWSATDGVAELFARVYASVGELQPAIDWYTRAVEVTAGDVSLRALEQRSNLRVRKAWETLDAAARGRSRVASDARWWQDGAPRARHQSGARRDPGGDEGPRAAHGVSRDGRARQSLRIGDEAARHGRARRRSPARGASGHRGDATLLSARGRPLREGRPPQSLLSGGQPPRRRDGAAFRHQGLEARRSIADRRDPRQPPRPEPAGPGLLERRRRDRPRSP